MEFLATIGTAVILVTLYFIFSALSAVTGIKIGMLFVLSVGVCFVVVVAGLALINTK